jgi:hypothetical protein
MTTLRRVYGWDSLGNAQLNHTALGLYAQNLYNVCEGTVADKRKCIHPAVSWLSALGEVSFAWVAFLPQVCVHALAWTRMCSDNGG